MIFPLGFDNYEQDHIELSTQGKEMSALSEGVNWTAVGLGTIVSFLLGWLWYSPRLFGSRLAERSGVDLASTRAMPLTAMGVQLLSTFLLAWLVGIMETRQAFLEAVLIVGTIAVFLVASGMFGKKSGHVIAAEAGFVLATGAVMVLMQMIF